jgi:hypothetical protein
MKLLTVLGLLVVVLALTTTPTIEEKVDVQIEESKEMHDSAMKILVDLHHKNDSLLIEKYFYKK